MKTLVQLQNDVKIATNSYVIVALSKKRDQPSAAAIAEAKEFALFSELTITHALASLKAAELRAEMKVLVALRDAETMISRRVAGFEVPRKFAHIGPDGCVEINVDGLTRLAEIARLLGEGEEKQCLTN